MGVISEVVVDSVPWWLIIDFSKLALSLAQLSPSLLLRIVTRYVMLWLTACMVGDHRMSQHMLRRMPGSRGRRWTSFLGWTW